MFRSALAALTLAVLGALPADRAEAASITVAGGCFWCVEADFERVPGVTGAVSGFTGGASTDVTYKQVTSGGTGHLEAVRIDYDPARTNPKALYDLFFRSIDPTDAGGQFCDRGESYSTAIFVGSNAQLSAAKAAKADAEKALGRKIVTPIRKASAFVPAEAYHQDYYKSKDTVLTRFGAISKAKAYKRYRDACGRDQRVRELWGSAAPFIN